MPDDPPYILEMSGLSGGSDDQDPGPGREPGARPWIGMQFECCGVYTRIYRNQEGTAYEGRCPKCSRQVQIRIGPGGTSHRMFRAK